jgi:transposase
MAEKDIIMVRQKELKRLHVIHKVIEGTLSQREAGELTSLSERQIRRIVTRIKEEGDGGIIHKSRGKPSKRKLSHKLKERIIDLYRTTYTGFGPTLFTEKLEEREGITLSNETIRTWLMEEGEWKKHRKQKAHRQWRERKDHYGEMIQMDGSHHDWFEGRGPKCVFMGYIDDATSRVYGRFYEYEGTIPAMDSFKRYIKKYGIPMSVYLDKHSTYRSPAEPTLEDELNGTEPLSEFGRALHELGVELIHANSPQAKGRVERLFNTLQDRMVKEMRLKGISTIEEANKFLAHYLPVYNRRFAAPPNKKDNLHIQPGKVDLDAILCIKTQRTVRNDHVIQHNTKLYQIENRVHLKKVIVENRLDGTMRIHYGKLMLSFHEIEKRPEKRQKEEAYFKLKKTHKPSPDHPWRKSLFKKNPQGNMEKAAPLPHSPVTAETVKMKQERK